MGLSERYDAIAETETGTVSRLSIISETDLIDYFYI